MLDFLHCNRSDSALCRVLNFLATFQNFRFVYATSMVELEVREPQLVKLVQEIDTPALVEFRNALLSMQNRSTGDGGAGTDDRVELEALALCWKRHHENPCLDLWDLCIHCLYLLTKRCRHLCDSDVSASSNNPSGTKASIGTSTGTNKNKNKNKNKNRNKSTDTGGEKDAGETNGIQLLLATEIHMALLLLLRRPQYNQPIVLTHMFGGLGALINTWWGYHSYLSRSVSTQNSCLDLCAEGCTMSGLYGAVSIDTCTANTMYLLHSFLLWICGGARGDSLGAVVDCETVTVVATTACTALYFYTVRQLVCDMDMLEVCKSIRGTCGRILEFLFVQRTGVADRMYYFSVVILTQLLSHLTFHSLPELRTVSTIPSTAVRVQEFCSGFVEHLITTTRGSCETCSASSHAVHFTSLQELESLPIPPNPVTQCCLYHTGNLV
uniref:Trypsin inhibitor n=1 Tax=Lygus hesperus TaxID=30085 RepID=A0A0A9Y3V4_LYGHE